MKDKLAKRARKLRKHPFIIPVVTFVVLFFATLALFILTNGTTIKPSDSRIVLLSINGKQQVVPTRATTVSDMLTRQNITLGKGDVVEPDPDTPIVQDNFRVNVYRARSVIIYNGRNRYFANSAAPSARNVVTQAGITIYPEDNVDVVPIENFAQDGFASEKIVIDPATAVKVSLYGVNVVLRSHAKTVGDLLVERNIKLATKDTLKPKASILLTKAKQILIIRSGTTIATRKETFQPPMQIIDDPNLSFGVTVVRQAGQPGKRLVTYQVKVVNGKEVSRKVLQSVVIQEPVKRIVASGGYVNIPSDKLSVLRAAGISGADAKYADFIFSHESGWDAARTSANGCIGLGQNCPSGDNYFIKAACPAWQGDPVCQAKRFTGYASRYGGWSGSYNYWLSHHYW